MRFPAVLLLCLATLGAQTFARKPHRTDAAYANAVQASQARAIALFPEYDAEGTPLHQAVQDEIERQKKINPTYFKNTDWPERIARACAAVLGIEPSRPMQASK